MFKNLSIIFLLVLLTSCCYPERPVATINGMFKHNPEIVVKGYDCNCDSDIDYWQHYDGKRKLGEKKYTEGNYQRCEEE